MKKVIEDFLSLNINTLFNAWFLRDETDGLMNLSKAILGMTTSLVGVALRYSPSGSEEDDEHLQQADARKIGRERMHVKVGLF